MATYNQAVINNSFQRSNSHANQVVTKICMTETKGPLAAIKERHEPNSAKKTSPYHDMAKTELKARPAALQSVQCPSCQRKFSRRAAVDHIKFCSEKTKIEEFRKKWERKNEENCMTPRRNSMRSPGLRVSDFRRMATPRIDTGLHSPHQTIRESHKEYSPESPQ